MAFNDLPGLVDRGRRAPAARDLHVGLVHEQAIAHGVPAGWGGLGQQQGEPLHPRGDGHVVDLDAALSRQLLKSRYDSAKRRHRQDDYLGTEAEASKDGPCDRSGAGAAGSHGDNLPTPTSPTAGATAPRHSRIRLTRGRLRRGLPPATHRAMFDSAVRRWFTPAPRAWASGSCRAVGLCEIVLPGPAPGAAGGGGVMPVALGLPGTAGQQ